MRRGALLDYHDGLVDAALRVKACRCVLKSDSLRRCLETFLGVTNAMRVAKSDGILLGSLLALARAKADDAACVNAAGTDFEGAPQNPGKKKTFLDFVVETLCARGERETALRESLAAHRQAHDVPTRRSRSGPVHDYSPPRDGGLPRCTPQSWAHHQVALHP